MWLKAVLWYLLLIFKYLLVGLLVGGIVAIFFPPAGGIIILIFLIGSFPAAYKDLTEEKMPLIQGKMVRKRYVKLDEEFKGFEQALSLTRRNLP